VTLNLDFKVTALSLYALDVLCVQLTRDLFAIAKFLFCTVTDISATVTLIDVKFCMMVCIGPGQISSPF